MRLCRFALVMLTSILCTFSSGVSAADPAFQVVDEFDRADSLYHGAEWETLNPGYWKIEDGALRRRLVNRGDRARATGFPFHALNEGKVMEVDYDPSLPIGMLWRRDWKLKPGYTLRIDATILEPHVVREDRPDWNENQPGYGLIGVCFGGRTLYESWNFSSKNGAGAWFAGFRDDGRFGFYDHAQAALPVVAGSTEVQAAAPRAGDSFKITVTVEESDNGLRAIATLKSGAEEWTATVPQIENHMDVSGYFGVCARGLMDFRIDRVEIDPGKSERVTAEINELEVAYPLGRTLRREGDRWACNFVAIFRSQGSLAEIRVADSPEPAGGWASVPVAGAAEVVTNDFRLNTAVIPVTLPASPAEKTLYYTVWKDGVDVTADPREGFLGRKDYVGRLPQLTAPYRVCSLGCHAIHGGSPNLPNAGPYEEHWVHDQPTPTAYEYFEDYNFQIINWEDDVWYLELLLYPPSLDDAYKIVTLSIAGPTSRWQMMRHWNVLNPGDHDHGMDDVKGPEQYAVRQYPDLGQDSEYMRRNFQMVDHLMNGDEDPSGTENPKRWGRWKMPNGDFSLLILDARLWRSSQDTQIWDAEGWGHRDDTYDRTDPTRTLLGEEQFAWLSEVIRTDSSSFICCTGINAMQTIWQGWQKDPKSGEIFNQRDRVAADYAGWVKVGSDRVLELMGSRQGVFSIFGDIHLGSIIENVDHRFVECSFGPIGRTGGRTPKENFGPVMEDYDGRAVKVHAFYHDKYQSPSLEPLEGPKPWNFLELVVELSESDPKATFRLRNLVDPPSEKARGGTAFELLASESGRVPASRIPDFVAMPNADVLFIDEAGRPIRAARTLGDGRVPVSGLIDVAPGARVMWTAFNADRVESGSFTATAP